MSSENDDDDIPKQSKKRCDFFSSDDELHGAEGSNSTENSSLGACNSKGKRKRKFIPSLSDDSDDDESSIDNFNSKWKNKSRRGIIHSDSDSDGDSDESSGSERDENDENLCPICLGEFTTQLVGIPENCQHVFCIECIKEWSKNVNNCPVDRKKFNLIHVKDSRGRLIDEMVVEDPKKEMFEDPPTYCQICNECNREDAMLLCDECDHGYHMDCLTPPLECVPIDQWFCVECAPPPAPASLRKTRSRSERNGNRNDNDEEEESFIDDSEIHSEIYHNTIQLMNNAARRGREVGEGEGRGSRVSRVRRGSARTVATRRTNAAERFRSTSYRERRARGRPSRSSRGKRKSRSKSKSKRGRKKQRKSDKKKIESELKKVRKQIAKEEEELIRPAAVSLFGDPFYLDEIYPSAEEEEKPASPARSSLLNTPYVVGAILAFDSLNMSNVSVSRDGHGTLVPKVETKRAKPEPNKDTRKRTIRFDTPCDDEKKDDNASDIIGSILGYSNVHVHAPSFSSNDACRVKIKEEPDEYEQPKPKKGKRNQSEKRVKMSVDNGDDGKDHSDSDNGDKNDNCTGDKGFAPVPFLEDEPVTGQRIKVEQSDVKVKEEPWDEYSEVKPVISKEERKEDKNLLLHMRKRLKETMDKKTQAEKLEKECKQMREVSETIEYKMDGSLLNVASFKIPKRKKEDTEKSPEKTSTNSEKSDDSCSIPKRKKEDIEKAPEKTSTNSETSDDSCSNNCVKDDVVSRILQEGNSTKSVKIHQEGNSTKSVKIHQEGNSNKSMKKRPPLRTLKDKIKLYNEGVLKPSPKKHDKAVKVRKEKIRKESQEKDKKEKEKQRKEASLKRDKKEDNEKPSMSSSSSNFGKQCQNEAEMKKTISLKDYRNRNLCESLFGNAQLEEDLDVTTKHEKQGSSKETKTEKIYSNNTTSGKVNESSKDCTQIKLFADEKVSDHSGSASVKDTETKFKTNRNTYSKFINPSQNLYDDNETALRLRTSTYLPTKSTCTISKPCANIDSNRSQLSTEKSKLNTASVSSCEEQIKWDLKQAESIPFKWKSKTELCGREINTKEVNKNVLMSTTTTTTTTSNELKLVKSEKDILNNKSKEEIKLNSLKAKNNVSTNHQTNQLSKSNSTRDPRTRPTCKQNTVESKKALDLHLHKNISISLENNNNTRPRPGTCVSDEQVKSRPLDLRNESAILLDSCKGQSISNSKHSKKEASHSSSSKVQHKSSSSAVKKKVSCKQRENSEFEKNSPYSVVRPFTQSSSTSTNQTPVAVISPSLRGDTPGPSFKFKDMKTTDTTCRPNISLKPNETPISVPWALKTSAWVLNTSNNMAKKRVSSTSIKTNNAKCSKPVSTTESIDTMTNIEKNIIFNRRTSEDTKHDSKSNMTNIEENIIFNRRVSEDRKHDSKANMTNIEENIIFNRRVSEWISEDAKPNSKAKIYQTELDQESIEKIKTFLKPYYKRKMVTKDQWKAVMKAVVRVMRENPSKFTNDEDIKVLVQQHVSAYLK